MALPKLLLIFAWPSAQSAVMGGKQASETLLSIKLQQMQKAGAKMSEKEQQKLLGEVQARYEAELDPLYAAARLWVDGIVDPLATRSVIARAIGMAAANPHMDRFNPGVIQT